MANTSERKPGLQFAMISVAHEYITHDKRNPSAKEDYAIIEPVCDPLGLGILGKHCRIFLEHHGEYRPELSQVNSVYGLKFGFGPRRPAEERQIVAFERVRRLENGDLIAGYLKTGATPRDRMQELSACFLDVPCLVTRPRVQMDAVKQALIVAHVEEACRVETVDDLIAEVEAVKLRNRTPSGAALLGSPGYVLLSRYVGEQGERLDYSDPRMRLASIALMFPVPEDSQNTRDPVFVAMTPQRSFAQVEGAQMRRLQSGDKRWVHEFVPCTTAPLAATNMPKFTDGRFVGVDRSVPYKIYKPSNNGDVFPDVGCGFVNSMVMLQRSVRTDSWVATFTVPSVMGRFPIPVHELITPVTPLPHIRACQAVHRRVREICIMRLQSFKQKRAIRSTADAPAQRRRS